MPALITNAPGPADAADSYLDEAFVGAGGGLKADIDLASYHCWPSKAAPVNGSVVKDLSEAVGSDHTVVIAPGQTVAYAGGGFDFGGATAKGCYVRGPSTFASDVWGQGAGAAATAALSGGSAIATVNAGGAGYAAGATAVYSGGGLADPVAVPCTVVAGAITAIPSVTAAFTSAPTIKIVPSPQYWLMGVYVKVPALADFNASTPGTKPVLQFSDTYVTNPDIGTLSLTLNGGVPVLQFRRLTDRNVYKQSNLAIPASAHGKVALAAAFRTAAGLKLALITSDGVTQSGAAEAFGPNVDNFSACRPQLGLGVGHWALPDPLSKVRVYAEVLENLFTSGRDPLVFAQADFARRMWTPKPEIAPAFT